MAHLLSDDARPCHCTASLCAYMLICIGCVWVSKCVGACACVVILGGVQIWVLVSTGNLQQISSEDLWVEGRLACHHVISGERRSARKGAINSVTPPCYWYCILVTTWYALQPFRAFLRQRHSGSVLPQRQHSTITNLVPACCRCWWSMPAVVSLRGLSLSV